MEGRSFGGAENFTDQVKVAEGIGQKLGWIVEEDFGSVAEGDPRDRET